MKILKNMLLLMFLASPAYADDNPYSTLRELPVPTIQTVNGTQQACVDTDGWKKVMLIAVDYRGLFFWRLEILGVLSAHEQIVTAYELKISSYADTLKVLQAERSYLNTRVHELEDALNKRELANKLERYLAWGLVVVEGIALGALGIASYIQSH